MPKKLPYEDVQQELIAELQKLPQDLMTTDVAKFGQIMGRYTDKMVERALSRMEFNMKQREIGEQVQKLVGMLK